MYLISIITINYNNLEGLRKTVSSVLTQTLSDFEYIVIDGGSTDGSRDFLQKKSNKFHYWISEKDNGIYHAMNKGIAKATGEYILFLNSGDTLYSSEILQNLYPTLCSKISDLYYGNLEIKNSSKTYIHTFPKEIGAFYIFGNSLGHPSTFIRRTLFNIIGLYDENCKIISDWKWFVIAIVKYQVSLTYVDDVVSTFSMDGISSLEQNREDIINDRKKFIELSFPNTLIDYNLYLKRSIIMNRLRSILGDSYLEIMNRYFFKKTMLIIAPILRSIHFNIK